MTTLDDTIARIRDLVQRATVLQATLWEDEELLQQQLEHAVQLLDADAGPGLSIGRCLRFPVADGEVEYLIDSIEPQRVHVQWLPNADERWANEVDTDGYCLRSVAEAQLTRRDGGRR